jgi:hypothetical protein
MKPYIYLKIGFNPFASSPMNTDSDYLHYLTVAIPAADEGVEQPALTVK